MKDSLLYCEEKDNIFIRALGRITANICYQLRERVFARLNASPPAANIFIDLSRCDYMDSTFMGIILGINKKLKKTEGDGVTIVCPTRECSDLFIGLNILKLLTVNEKTVTFPEKMETISNFEKPSPEVMLRAHDELIEATDANAERFKLLREILQKKVMEERKKETEKNIFNDETDDDLDEPPLTNDGDKLSFDD